MSALPQPKPGILDIKPYVAGKSKAAAEIQRIIKLASNENALGPSPKALQAYADHAARLHRYPDSAALALREAIAQVHEMDPARIICGSGSDELIGMLAHAYAGVGDEVLISRHGFLMYKIYAQSNGAACVSAPEKNLAADVDSLLACVTERTRIVFLANPNNPTGSYISASELKRLRDHLPQNILLVIDGAYTEYVSKPDYSSGREWVDATENTVMLRTFSKIYGLSSLRIGWGYFPASIADVINRIRGPFNVSGPALAAGTAAVLDTAYVSRMREFNAQWLAWMQEQFEGIGLRVYPSVANFLLVEFPAEDKTSAAANAFLLKRGIIPREVAGYGLPHCLRITIGTEEENRACAEALATFMQTNA